MTSPFSLPLREPYDGVVYTGRSAVLLEPAAPVGTDPFLGTVQALAQRMHEANAGFDKWDRYYTGDQPMQYMAPAVRAQVGTRLGRLVLNWPEVIVDSVNRRLGVDGFSLGESSEADAELWRIYTANELDEETPLGFADALVHGITYLLVWPNDDDPSTPVITYESAHQMAVEYEPGNRRVRAALKRWRDGDTEHATLYLSDRVIRYEAPGSALDLPSLPAFERVEVLDNPFGAVPVVPMVNRGRLLNRGGRSELASVAPIADGINKLVADMMTTSEFYVTPRRWATGFAELPPPGSPEHERFRAMMREFVENADKATMLTAGQGVAFGQFPEATLDGFVKGVHLLTSALAAIGGLPPDDLGLNQVNPASAEARRAAETTLVNRVREKHSSFGGGLKRTMRLAVAALDGRPLAAIDPRYGLLAVDWRDPATPALSQAMDAAAKGKEAGIYDDEAAREQVGLSVIERAAIKARAEEAAAAAATSDVRARYALARELMTDGLDQNAALAAVGLLQAAALNSAAQQPPAPPQ